METATLSLLMGVIFVVSALAESPIPTDANQLPLWEVRQWDDRPIVIHVPDHQTLQRLLAEVTLHSFSREELVPTQSGWLLQTRVTAAEAEALRAAGWAFDEMLDGEQIRRAAVEKSWALNFANTPIANLPDAKSFAKSDAAAIDYYPTHEQLGTLLGDLAAAYPEICRTFSWGQSVQGRQLWGLVISADVNQTTAEPEIRLSSTMHGDEVVGMVMLMNLAHHLVQNYGQVGYDDLTALVNSTEIHLMVLHNPDGYVAGTRRNANNIDLNRNFILPNGTHTTEEIENVNFKNYSDAHHFVISENGHGGALVVNYPWDYTYTLAPDNDAMIALSLAYSTTNIPMYNGSFSQGITNGADWYVVYGSGQDWSYDQTDCIDVTIEFSNVKWPVASTLSGHWDNNRESFMNFMAAAKYGVNGLVTDAGSGLPLNAVVAVTGNSKSVSTDPAHGDYYKLLDTGTYEMTFSADGYDPQTFSSVATTWGTPTVLNVQLVSDAANVPTVIGLAPQLQAWPNPFNPTVTLSVKVNRAGPIEVDVYDLSGRLVRGLMSGQAQEREYILNWDGRADDGASVATGVYFVRVHSEFGADFKKLVLMK